MTEGDTPVRIFTYDPASAPPQSVWSALDEEERIFVVTTWHKKNQGPKGLRHPETQNLRLHALTHVVTENLLTDVEAPTQMAYDAFIAKGLSRHEAVHAIGSAVVQCMLELAHKGEEYSSERFREELERLDPNQFFATAPDASS